MNAANEPPAVSPAGSSCSRDQLIACTRGQRGRGRTRYPRPVTTVTPPATDLRLVVGFDGSPPAIRALDAAVNLLQGRTGGIDVVYVAHMPSMAALSPGAVSELEIDFDDIEQELRTMVGERLRGREERWGFERRQGLIAEELLAAAKDTGAAHPDATVVVVVGSSSLVAHRVVGSVAVSLARHSPVPLVVVP
jgi:nucleotide-binding universal stress UspA family protein